MNAVRNKEIWGFSRCLWVEEVSPSTAAGLKGPGLMRSVHVACVPQPGRRGLPAVRDGRAVLSLPQELTLISSSPPLPTRGRPSGNIMPYTYT